MQTNYAKIKEHKMTRHEIDDAQSHKDLIRIIKAQMFIHNIDSSPESDLIINY